MPYSLYSRRAASIAPGKSLFLLGQSKDGPVNEPILVESYKDAEKIFGKGNLLDAYAQVQDIPEIAVHLMRISGTYARLSLLGNSGAGVHPVIHFRSAAAGVRYNDIRIYISEVVRDGMAVSALVIEAPSHAESARSYVLADYGNIAELVRQINRDTYLRRGYVHASVADADFPVNELLSLNSDILNMLEGTDGDDLTKNELYVALEESYGVLEGRVVDVICPFPVRLDDLHPSVRYGGAGTVYGEVRYGEADYLGLYDEGEPDIPLAFHAQLIAFCQLQERFGLMTHGVMGLKEIPEGDAMTPRYVARLAGASAFSDRYGLTEYIEGNYVDKGSKLSVFAQDIRYGGIVRNGCAMYAGMVAQLEPEQTTTNRRLPKDIELAFELSPAELRGLSEIGVVAARGSVRKGIVITNGVTAGLPASPLHLIGNVRMVQYTLESLKRALDGMMGEPYIPTVTLREVENRSHEVLFGLVNRQVLTDYELAVSLDQQSMVVSVELSLQPRYSVEYIKAVSNLEFTASGGE